MSNALATNEHMFNIRELSTQDPRWITGGISTNWQTVAKPLPAYLAAFSFNIKPFLAAAEAPHPVVTTK